MKILFVFNSNEVIGRGHEARCMNIAGELLLRGCDLYLATSKKSKLLEKSSRVFSKKFFFEKKDSLLSFILDGKSDYDRIVIDTYDISKNEIIEMSYGCNFYKFDLDPCLEERRVKYITFDPKFHGCSDFHCLGPRYYPFKKQFIEAKPLKDKKNKSMFVFFGGGDNTNLIKKYVDYFSFMNSKGFQINLVVTKFYSDLAKVKKAMRYANFIKEPTNIAEIIAKSTFCLVSGGSIIYECVFLGKIPQVISVALNQVSQSCSFNDVGSARYVGQCDEISSHELIDDFDQFSSYYLDHRKTHTPIKYGFEPNILARDIYNGF